MITENRIDRLGLLLAACGLAGAASAGGGTLVTKFSENFDKGWVLGPNIEEGALIDPNQPELGTFTGPFQDIAEAFFGDGNDGELGFGSSFDGTWTQRGWRQTFNLRGFGVAEWGGWTVANGVFWATADDQRRTEFISEHPQNDGTGRASGNVAVADPDEWDDFDPLGIDPESQGPYNTELFTPVFPIGGTDPDSIVITFDSSWRPEQDDRNQQARLSVAFDNGPFIQLFYWDSTEGSPNFKPDAPNEAITLNLNGVDYVGNPAGAQTMQLKFELFDAANDWWWAFDNLIVAGTGGDPVLPPEDFQLSAQAFYPNASVAISWTLSINATQYLIQFARDENFSDIRFATVTSDLSFTAAPGNLEPGVYFVKVTATNPIGTREKTAVIGIDMPCPADFDGNGIRDLLDITSFIADFLGANCNP